MYTRIRSNVTSVEILSLLWDNKSLWKQISRCNEKRKHEKISLSLIFPALAYPTLNCKHVHACLIGAAYGRLLEPRLQHTSWMQIRGKVLPWGAEGSVSTPSLSLNHCTRTAGGRDTPRVESVHSPWEKEHFGRLPLPPAGGKLS